MKRSLPMKVDFTNIEYYETNHQTNNTNSETFDIEKIKHALTNSSQKVVALLDYKIKKGLSESDYTILHQELKAIGFYDIIVVDLGLKVKAIEEVDYLMKLIVNKMDEKESRLPLIITDHPDYIFKIEHNYLDIKKFLSPIKSSFQIEGHIYKKYLKQNDAYLVYITNNTITNANYRYYLNEDLDNVLSLEKLSSIKKDFKRFEIIETVDDSELFHLTTQSFYELANNHLPTELKFQNSEDVWELDIEKHHHHFKMAILNKLEDLPKVLDEKVMIGLISGGFNSKSVIGESIYQCESINNIYQKYLKHPGNNYLKKITED